MGESGSPAKLGYVVGRSVQEPGPGMKTSVICFGSLSETLSSVGNPLSPHVTRAHRPCHMTTLACVPNISSGDIMPLLIAQVFHSLPGLTQNLHHFWSLALALFVFD